MLEITDEVTARGLRITLRGEAYVHWTEQHGSGQHSHTVSYTDRETYVNQCVTVWGKEEGDREGENPTLYPGIHTFPFSFQVPHAVPSSLEPKGPFRAHIRYWVTANVDRPWKFDYKCKQPFTVIARIDINDPVFLTPMRSDNEKHLCCLCCKSGPLNLEASIDRAGYCPGESVTISATARNMTSRSMRGMRGRLISITTVTARGHRRTGTTTICEIMGEELRGGAFDQWGRRSLAIPPAPPSVKSCRIIDHSYYVQIAVVVPRGINLKILFPVVIGTVPLREDEAEAIQSQPQFIDNRSLGVRGVPQAIAMPHEPVVVPSAPPCYAEAVDEPSVNIGESDDKYTYGNLQYLPRYPYIPTYSQTNQPWEPGPPGPPPGEYPMQPMGGQYFGPPTH